MKLNKKKKNEKFLKIEYLFEFVLSNLKHYFIKSMNIILKIFNKNKKI